MTGALLVPRQDEIKVLGVVDSVKDGEDGSLGRKKQINDTESKRGTSHKAWVGSGQGREITHTGVTKDVLDVMPKHHLVEDFTTRFADKSGRKNEMHKGRGNTGS